MVWNVQRSRDGFSVRTLDGQTNDVRKRPFTQTLFPLFNQNSKAQTLAGFLQTFFLFAKILITVLLLIASSSLWKPIGFLALGAATQFLLSRPFYKGPSKMEFLSPLNFDESVMRRTTKKDNSWVVFFTVNQSWHSRCVDVDAIVSRISAQYGGKTKFGKVDVSRWPGLATRFQIEAKDYNSKQLPTLILFENGVEVKRLPPRKPNGDVIGVQFDVLGVSKTFGLDLKRE
ncbi:thioredoxin domain-containing protein [bacterium]|nr:thioredoxin domain-containing protein [bacterium]